MYRKSVFLLALIGICLTAGTAGAQLVVKINFQLDSAAVPTGYLMDCGQVFGDRGNGYSYGWSADATADDRERNTNNDQRYDTFLHFSKNADKTWEIELPPGEYDLFFVCGDQDNTNQTNSLDVEGITATDPDGEDNFDEYTLTAVPVTDGRLTIKPVTSGLNAKFCFIDIAQVVTQNKATDPVPEDAITDVVRDVVLAWTAAESAGKHHVYLGTNADDVTNATLTEDLGILVAVDQTDAAYEPAGVLAYGQTYYWRIDEVNAADDTVTKGDLWSFTVEPYAYPVENVTATASSFQTNMGPENTVNGSGLNTDDQHSMELKDTWLSNGTQPNWIQYEFEKAVKVDSLWVWNSNQMIENILGFGAKSVTIEYSLDGAAWTELANVPEFAQATSTATYACNTTVDFGGAMAKYVKLTIHSTWGGGAITGLSEVRFFSAPVEAREPEPTDAATGVAIDTTLNWRPGREAASHTVYFGIDVNAVAEGAAAAEVVADASYSPADMVYGETYYWRVDEVNEAMDPALYPGSVWSFTTADYATVDDFERYNDSDVLLYEFWIDGLADKNSGSMAGYIDSIDGTFGERTIIHSGGQSMPVTYDNASTFSFSEVTRTFDTAQDWTADGIKSLRIFLRGTVANTGQLYLKINNTKVPYPGDAADIAKPVWLSWNIDLSTVGGNLSKVTKLTIGIEGAGSAGMVYIDDIRLYPTAPAPAKPSVLASVTRANGQTGTRTDASPFTTFTESTTPVFVAGGLQDGAYVFSDRPYPWANTPSELIGADYILTFNNDKTAGETDVAYTVTLNRAATVFLTCDDRITDQQAAVDLVVAAFAQPGQFKNTGLKLSIRENATTDRPMSVFAADLPAGTYVFGAQDSGYNFYNIAAVGK